MSNNVVIVLGMHRSGTSCLTGLLQQAGLELGDVVKEAPHNKKGNRENLDIMALNNEVLSFSDGSWDLPPENLSWNEQHQNARNIIINSYSDRNVWGFKDPRVLFTLPFWIDGLKGVNLHYIGTFRHPLQVAKSLNARQGNLSIEKGVELWKSYNEKLFEYHKQYNFPIINFDLEPKSYIDSVLEAIKKLGILSFSNVKGLDFFDNDLRHQIELDTCEIQKYYDSLKNALPLYQQFEMIA